MLILMKSETSNETIKILVDEDEEQEEAKDELNEMSVDNDETQAKKAKIK